MLGRNGRPKMKLIIFIKVLALGILQPVLDTNLYFMGAMETSASFSSSLENINPATTFVICLLLRMEKLNIRQKHGLAKVIGAFLCVIGAILMILYKGPHAQLFWTKPHSNNEAHANGQTTSSMRWFKGTLMVLGGCFSWCSFLILQTYTLKSYPAKLSLTVMVCSIGAVLNAVIALVVEHGRLQPWILGWDLRLFAAIYSGVICTALMYFVLAAVMKEKGPVFASAFNPLTMVMTNVLGAIFLGEKTALGTIIGASILVGGMYFILWSKSKENFIMLEKQKSITGFAIPSFSIEGESSSRPESQMTEKENSV